MSESQLCCIMFCVVAHNGGHVIDLASLLAFFEKELINKTNDMTQPSALADADKPRR